MDIKAVGTVSPVFGFADLMNAGSFQNSKFLEAIVKNANPQATVQVKPLANDWNRVWVTAFTPTTPSTGNALALILQPIGTGLYVAGLEVWIQNLQMYHDSERSDQRTYCPQLINGSSEIIAKADDYSTASLADLGANWSVTFDWLPLNGNLAFPEVGANTKVHIATIQGVTGYLELYWDRAAFDGSGGGMAFKITDGTNTVSLDADQGGLAMEWLHNDLLKFGITSDGVDTILYCYNPENRFVHVPDPEESVILSKSGLAVIDTPAQIELGSNEDNTIIGAGAFANIRGFESVLTESEIEDVFDSVGSIEGDGDPRERFYGTNNRSRDRFITTGRF
jgi:hypothetical protein